MQNRQLILQSLKLETGKIKMCLFGSRKTLGKKINWKVKCSPDGEDIARPQCVQVVAVLLGFGLECDRIGTATILS